MDEIPQYSEESQRERLEGEKGTESEGDREKVRRDEAGKSTKAAGGRDRRTESSTSDQPRINIAHSLIQIR